MQYITEINSYKNEKKSAVTLGKFDALHRGHQKLIDKICEYADENTVSIVCAFDMGKQVLLTGEEKKKSFGGTGGLFDFLPVYKRTSGDGSRGIY